jgi:hypothetical protein
MCDYGFTETTLIESLGAVIKLLTKKETHCSELGKELVALEEKFDCYERNYKDSNRRLLELGFGGMGFPGYVQNVNALIEEFKELKGGSKNEEK